jgi:hypothetical protein
MAGSKSAVILPAPPGSTPAQAAQPAPAGSPTFMAGSKSIILAPPAAQSVAPPAIIYSSKWAPIFPAQPLNPAAQQAPPAAPPKPNQP